MLVALNARMTSVTPHRADAAPGSRAVRPWRLAGLRTYWLFRCAGEADLLCAAPADGPLPRFVERSSAWEFVARCDRSELARFGVDLEAADHGLRLAGFHLFMNLNLDWRAIPRTGLPGHGAVEPA